MRAGRSERPANSHKRERSLSFVARGVVRNAEAGRLRGPAHMGPTADCQR